VTTTKLTFTALALLLAVTGGPAWDVGLHSTRQLDANSTSATGLLDLDGDMVCLTPGKPKQISETGFEKGPDELWVYGEPHLAYVFTDGVVTGFKD